MKRFVLLLTISFSCSLGYSQRVGGPGGVGPVSMVTTPLSSNAIVNALGFVPTANGGSATNVSGGTFTGVTLTGATVDGSHTGTFSGNGASVTNALGFIIAGLNDITNTMLAINGPVQIASFNSLWRDPPNTWGGGKDDPTYNTFNSRYAMITGPKTYTDIQVLFRNWNFSSLNNQDVPLTPGSNTLTITACLEYPVGIISSLRFNGADSRTLSIGGTAITDKSGIVLPPNSKFWIRMHGTVPTNGAWPIGNVTSGTWVGYSGGYEEGHDLIDKSTNGVITDGVAYAYTPTAVIGNSLDGLTKSYYVCGDSIVVGAGGGLSFDLGFMQLLTTSYRMGGTFGVQVPTIINGVSGAGINDGLTNYYANPLINYTTTIISQYGVNNIRGYALPHGGDLPGVTNAYRALWKGLARGGKKVYQTTLTPVSDSTDVWTTAVNQTGVVSSQHTQINNFIRWEGANHMDGLSGYIEVGAIVETATNSNIWLSPRGIALTSDGLHPNAFGNAWMVTNAIPVVLP